MASLIPDKEPLASVSSHQAEVWWFLHLPPFSWSTKRWGFLEVEPQEVQASLSLTRQLTFLALQPKGIALSLHVSLLTRFSQFRLILQPGVPCGTHNYTRFETLCKHFFENFLKYFYKYFVFKFLNILFSTKIRFKISKNAHMFFLFISCVPV